MLQLFTESVCTYHNIWRNQHFHLMINVSFHYCPVAMGVCPHHTIDVQYTAVTWNVMHLKFTTHIVGYNNHSTHVVPSTGEVL